MSGERSEAPTPRRRAEARDKGQVARSREISSVGVLFVGLMVLSSQAGGILSVHGNIAREAFLQVAVRDSRPEALLALAASMVATSATSVAPMVLAVGAAGMIANLAQVGPMLNLQTLKPDFNKVNPLQGVKRLFSGQSLMELAKAFTKLAVMGFIAYQVIRENFGRLVALQAASAEGSAGIIAGLIAEIAFKSGLALLVMAAADYLYQRKSFEGSLKMSRQEVKEEMRSTEGDPQLKGKIRQTQRQMATRRMMQSVPLADVVITNPTHFAVAIQYKPITMQAPLVVAKGQDLIAERIKSLAREHGVPVIENPPIARALHRSVEIGDAIPRELYQAVAEVLAFIYRLKHEGSPG